jgi:hypothetical protein
MHSNIVKCRRVHHFGFAKPNSVLNRVIGQSLVVWAIAEGRRVAQAVEKVLVGGWWGNGLAKKRGDFEVRFCPPVTN